MPVALAILALLVPIGQAQTAPPAVALSADAEARWVDFELTPGNQIRFQMLLNGKPATAMLDTGVSYSVVSKAFAARAGLKAAAVASQADAIGGTVELGWASTTRLQFGGLTRRGGRIAVVDLKPIAAGGGEPIDVLIGADLLSCCALDIDYDAKRFRLLPSGRLPYRGPTAPLSLSASANVYVSDLTLGGRRLRPVIVDTGDGSAVTVSRDAWHAAGIRNRALTSTIAYGLGGPIETDVTILPSLRVGNVPARTVEVRIEGAEGFSQRTGTAGRIGSGFLQRYRVLLDPGAGRMVLSPGAEADSEPVRSTSGLLVGFDAGKLRVLHVMRNGPAAAQGWKAGETICRVDDAAVPERADGAFAVWAADTPGRIVRLGLCDGEERALKLAAFY